MRVTATTTGLDEVRRAMANATQAPKQALARAAEDVEEFVEGAAGTHSKSGALVASTYLRRVGQDFEVGHDGQRAPHALFVHWGTRPHKIAPKKKGVLRWAGGGLFHFAKAVNHPGYRGDPWMTRAAAMAPRLFDQHLQALLQQGA